MRTVEGGCDITDKGITHIIHGIEPVDATTGLAAFPPSQRRILALLRRSHFVRFQAK